ncbi:NAD-dependent epimerase/dehydratase family protein [Candidatus Margulisiibacteriota bacterium]
MMDDSKEYILVTGATGFIGSHLCERLLVEKYNLIGIDNFDPFYDKDIKIRNLEQIRAKAQAPDQFEFLELSITNQTDIFKNLESKKIKMIIHLAAKAGVRPSIQDPLGYAEANILGTQNMLEFCKVRKVGYFVFGSSSSVYGNNKKLPFSEEDRVDKPISPYAATKRAGELLCHTYADLFGIKMVVLRFFTVYGARQRPDLAIHKFTDLIRKGKPIQMYGDGTSQRDYTYIDDIIDGIMGSLKWIENPENQNKYEIFNLGESDTVDLKKLISLIEKNLNKDAIIEKAPWQAGDVDVTYADITKAKEFLGYSPQMKIEKGIPRFVEWFLDSQKKS